MTTSGVQNFSQTTIELVDDAFDELRILSEGRSISANQRNKAVRKLNTMIQTWQTQAKINAWKNREATLFLERGVQSYLLGNNQANATESFVKTTVSVAASSGASTITVDDDTGILDGDFIGIVLTRRVRFSRPNSFIIRATRRLADNPYFLRHTTKSLYVVLVSN